MSSATCGQLRGLWTDQEAAAFDAGPDDEEDEDDDEPDGADAVPADEDEDDESEDELDEAPSDFEESEEPLLTEPERESVR